MSTPDPHPAAASGTRVLRWGILGTARITRSLVPALKAASGHELVAVASRSAEKAQAHAAQWEIPRTFASYEALLADPDIDIVYIPLPNHLHCEWAIKAMEAGKHVLCEKPLALTVADVDRLADVAVKTGRVLAEGFMYRHHPQTATLERLVRDGAIGELLLVRGSFSFSLNRPADVRWEPSYGGGALWDIGCYPVSLARLLAGAEPREAFGRAVHGVTGIDEVFVGQLAFSDRLTAQIDCSFCMPFRTEAEIIGTTGALRVAHPFKPTASETLLLSRGDDVESIVVQSDADTAPLYLGEVEDLGAAILDGRAPRVSLAESRGNIATLVALYESARTGQPVSVAPSFAR